MLTRSAALSVAIMIGLLAWTAIPEAAQDTGPIVTMPEQFDISPPLRDINVPPVVEADKHERPLHMPRSPRSPASGPDPVVQSTTDALVSATGGVSFDGVGANGYAPPDTNMAVGPNHIVQWVNVRFAIYQKNGTILAGFPKGGNAIWSGFGGTASSRTAGIPSRSTMRRTIAG